MANAPIALQLYSVRGECNKDLPATLKAVAELGYVGVEPYGYQGDVMEWVGHSAEDIRKMLDDNGLTCCGIHLSTDALRGDNLARTVAFNQILGNNFLVIAADKGRMSSVETIKELAGILHDAADAVRSEGMFTGYHAHGFDFERVGDETAWDILFSNTRADIIMQLDVGNCAGGGGDPIGVLRKFPHRARSMHLKDYGEPGIVIGEGEADWDTIFHLCDTTQDVEWYVVEEGGADGTGFDVCQRSLEALRRMGR